MISGRWPLAWLYGTTEYDAQHPQLLKIGAATRLCRALCGMTRPAHMGTEPVIPSTPPRGSCCNPAVLKPHCCVVWHHAVGLQQCLGSESLPGCSCCGNCRLRQQVSPAAVIRVTVTVCFTCRPAGLCCGCSNVGPGPPYQPLFFPCTCYG